MGIRQLRPFSGKSESSKWTFRSAEIHERSRRVIYISCSRHRFCSFCWSMFDASISTFFVHPSIMLIVVACIRWRAIWVQRAAGEPQRAAQLSLLWFELQAGSIAAAAQVAGSFGRRSSCGSRAVTGCSGAGGLPAGLASQSAPAAAACKTAQLAAQSAERFGRIWEGLTFTQSPRAVGSGESSSSIV